MRKPGKIGRLALLALSISAHYARSAEPVLTIVAEPHPPYEMVDPQTRLAVGADIDIARAICRRLAIQCQFQLMPWKRAWTMLAAGEADAGLSVSFTEARKPYLIWPQESMWTSQFVFFTQKALKRADLDGYDDVKRLKLRVGIIAGNAYHPSFWQAFPYQDAAQTVLHPQLEAANNVEQNMMKLASHRFDLFPIDLRSGQIEIARLHLEDSLTWYDKVLFSKPYFMPFSRAAHYPRVQDVAVRFDRELARMKHNGEYDRIMKVWLP